MGRKSICILYTDLDGTLLDHTTYKFTPAQPALRLLRKKRIPVILCSSKTYKEIMTWRKKLNIDHPLIVENGGAVYIPEGYFNYFPQDLRSYDEFRVMAFGADSTAIVKKLKRVKKTFQEKIRYFAEMSPGEIQRRTGLSRFQSRLAKEREYGQPCVIENAEGTAGAEILRAIENAGLQWTSGGRFIHVMRGNDKGKAVRWLTSLYRRNHYDRMIGSIGIGDSYNDFPMLVSVDYPFIVQKSNGRYDRKLNNPRFVRAGAPGPEGWNRVVMKYFNKICSA